MTIKSNVKKGPHVRSLFVVIRCQLDAPCVRPGVKVLPSQGTR